MIDDYFLMSSALKKVRAAQASHTRLCQLADFPSVRAALASHTRLCQLADFPSVRAAQAFILRSSFADPSLILR